MINIHKVKTYSVKARRSKVRAGDFARPPAAGRSFREFYNSLPHILKGQELRSVVDAVVGARKRAKSVILMAGAHLIKCGLNPVVIELIRRRIITCICLNGAGIIHDFELALQAKTSEDVGENLKHGRFGMGKETADFINHAAEAGVVEGLGLGYAVASRISAAKLPHKSISLLHNAYQHKVPVCVFVAVGTDIVHQHPSFNAAMTAQGSMRDFYTLVEQSCGLNGGGIVINVGSAVILPEVFLKALNLARNLGNTVKDFTTANFDMLYHYRPSQNVVARPVMSGGSGHYIIGHHELMFPLLAQAIIEKCG